MSEDLENSAEGTKEDKASPAEQKAINAGWVPEDKWNGEAADWVDYTNFNMRGELMGRISEQSSIINHLQDKVSTRDKTIEDLADLQNKISEREYKKALSDLKNKKAQALDDDEFHKVVELDEEISELKSNKPVQPEAQQQVAPNTPKEVTDWLQDSRNNWYTNDELLRSVADGISTNIMRNNPNITPPALLKQLDETIRKEMPHKFTNNNTVDSGNSQFTGGGRSTGKLPSFSDLTDEQQAVAKRFASQNVMTKKEYIESLVDLGEL